jgi:hypothetical protein
LNAYPRFAPANFFDGANSASSRGIENTLLFFVGAAAAVFADVDLGAFAST